MTKFVKHSLEEKENHFLVSCTDLFQGKCPIYITREIMQITQLLLFRMSCKYVGKVWPNSVHWSLYKICTNNCTKSYFSTQHNMIKKSVHARFSYYLINVHKITLTNCQELEKWNFPIKFETKNIAFNKFYSLVLIKVIDKNPGTQRWSNR